MTEVKRSFTVNGKPFYPLGGEWLYMTGYSIREKSEIDEAFKAIKMIHGNSLAVEVYWDQIEPEEGKFDFTSVDAIIDGAMRYGVKLILLWFATWKNGNMDFTPMWIKNNPKRFKRVTSLTGNEIWVLSSHCQANLEADKKAFAALCKHIQVEDNVEHTVIGIQVENEPGIIGSDRDYGSEAQTVFDKVVPTKLVQEIKKAGKGKVFDIWQQAGGKASGTWSELFGWEAGELMTAWSIAAYIDGVAEAGKSNYNIPMFINVWMMEQNWWPLPGEAYPSGGAVTKTLDIYKWFTPHIDFIAPDNYHIDSRGFESICATYARADNPLFFIETNRSSNIFRAIAEYGLTGYFASGLEWINADDCKTDPKSKTNVDICQCIAASIPLLLKFQGTSKIHAVIEEENLKSQYLDFDGYMGQVQFGPVDLPYRKKREINGSPHGWGMVIQASRNEFFLVGDNYRLFLRPKPSVDKMRVPVLVAKSLALLGHFISVDEGHFDSDGEFKIDCRRNGDLISLGLWVTPEIGLVRAVLCE